MNAKRKLVLITCACFLVQAMTAYSQSPWPRRRIPTAKKETTNQDVFRKYRCECLVNPEGWKCDQLVGFEDYEWTHEEITTMANNILTLSEALPEKNFSIAIQGIADSKRIVNPRGWREVEDERCRKGQNDPRNIDRKGISNRGLAWLRSCMTSVAIDDAIKGKQHVELLEPTAYLPRDRKYGDLYKAAIVYLLGNNGGCK